MAYASDGAFRSCEPGNCKGAPEQVQIRNQGCHILHCIEADSAKIGISSIACQLADATRACL